METWTEIRFLYFQKRLSMRQIAKTLGIHRNTVKRAIETRGGPRYERKGPYPSVLEEFKAEIEEMIDQTNGLVPTTVIYEKLSQRLGTPAAPTYCGSYETLQRYVRQLKEKSKPREAFLRIETPPGLDAQCDWGKVDLVIGGKPMRISLFVMTLSYSRYRYTRLFPCERQEFFFTGHVEAFRLFGGVPKQVTYDNLTTAVAKVLSGRNRQEQEAFARFRGEFPFGANFAAVRKGNEKGKVENSIKYVRSHAFGLDKEFDTLDCANTHLHSWSLTDARRVHSTHKEVIKQRFEAEKSYLSPLPRPMPPTCRVVTAKVNKLSMVEFETNRYSVPTAFVHQRVLIKAFEQRVLICVKDQVIATHKRLFTRRTEQIDPYHFLPLLEKKARAVDHAIVMQSWALDPILYQLKIELVKICENPNRQWIKILRLSEEVEMAQLVEAVKMAFVHQTFDYESIKNFLHQQVCPAREISTSNWLATKPKLASVAIGPRPLTHYDVLLGQGGEA